ncbi:MAG: DUF1624 domain-containing protein [Eubacterium sp.]|nr:DUF1624 domain-containing protein [Eubacterium sp.]
MSVAGLLSKEPVNTGRQKEIDLIKAFSIIMMIITHCIEELYNYEGNLPSEIIIDVLNETIGASAFMICMGIGIAYARKMDPGTFFKRGISLLIVGQVLNLFRYAVPNVIDYLFTGNEVSRKTVFLVFSVDIMQFAGWTFLLFALLKRLHFNETMIFIVAIALNIIGMFLTLNVDTGNYAVNQALGNFIFTESESYFPLFNWFIYPAFGLLFGTILKRVNDKKRFYLCLIIPTGIITAVYYVVGLCVDQPVFVTFQDPINYNAVGIFDAMMQLFAVVCLISLAFFITQTFSQKVMVPVNFISTNINRFYCTQWVIIGCCSVVFVYWFDPFPFDSAILCYLTALAVIVATWIIVYLYVKYLAGPTDKFIAKTKYVWYVIVVVLSVILCKWAFIGLPMPNLFNDYL